MTPSSAVPAQVTSKKLKMVLPAHPLTTPEGVVCDHQHMRIRRKSGCENLVIVHFGGKALQMALLQFRDDL